MYKIFASIIYFIFVHNEEKKIVVGINMNLRDNDITAIIT